MITKVYRSTTLAEAVQQIRREMGSRAAIADIKKIRFKSGLFGLKVRFGIEVTATIEERFLSPDQLEFLMTNSSAKKTVDNKEAEVNRVPENGGYDRKMNQLEKNIANLKSEIDDLRRMLSRNSSDFLSLPLSPREKAINDMELYLAGQGMLPTLRDLWKKEIQSDDSIDKESLLSRTGEFFSQQISEYQNSMPDILALVGAKSSGKTTTVLKLATALGESTQKCTIGALDVQDQGSVDRLKTYSNENEMSFEMIDAGNGLAHLREKVNGQHPVIIDTGSFSDSHSDPAARLARKLALNNIPTLLVLSAVSLDLDEAKRLVELFEPIGVIFTHMDEAFTVGPVFNFLFETKVSPVFFGMGTSIEDDLELASGDRLVSLLLRVDVNAESELIEGQGHKEI